MVSNYRRLYGLCASSFVELAVQVFSRSFISMLSWGIVSVLARMFFYHTSEMVLTSAFFRSHGVICFDIVRCCAVLFEFPPSRCPLVHSMLFVSSAPFLVSPRTRTSLGVIYLQAPWTWNMIFCICRILGGSLWGSSSLLLVEATPSTLVWESQYLDQEDDTGL